MPMMKCGHAANAINSATKKPVCVICAGIVPGAKIVDDAPPDLSGRTARCAYYGTTPRGRNHESNHDCKRGQPCLCEEPSSKGPDGTLAFFEYHPDKPYDEFYCGCHGWD